jgi:hypothetical protein
MKSSEKELYTIAKFKNPIKMIACVDQLGNVISSGNKLDLHSNVYKTYSMRTYFLICSGNEIALLDDTLKIISEVRLKFNIRLARVVHSSQVSNCLICIDESTNLNIVNLMTLELVYASAIRLNSKLACISENGILMNITKSGVLSFDNLFQKASGFEFDPSPVGKAVVLSDEEEDDPVIRSPMVHRQFPKRRDESISLLLSTCKSYKRTI